MKSEVKIKTKVPSRPRDSHVRQNLNVRYLETNAAAFLQCRINLCNQGQEGVLNRVIREKLGL